MSEVITPKEIDYISEIPKKHSMTITPFLSQRGALSYLIEHQHTVTLIDPSLEECERIVIYLKQHNLTLTTVLETHTHADFFSSVGVLRELYPHINSYRSNFEDISIDGLATIQTHGHTQNSVTFHLLDGEQDYLFTGDTLLIGSTGRTDFQGGSSIDLYHSLAKILTFPTNTIIHPGHNYKGITHTTLAQELTNNPRLILVKARKYDEFVTLMNNHTPPKPDLFEESLAYNSPLY